MSIVALVFAVSFHESAHGYVAMRCGDNTAKDLGRITLNPLKHIDPIGSIVVPLVLALFNGPIFGWAKPVPVSLRNVPNPRRAWLLVAAAGPLSNLVLAILSAAVVFGLRAAGIAVSGGFLYLFFYLFIASVVVNVSLAIFNLLPVPPLDGFGVLESLLPPRFARATLFLRQFGFLILVILLSTPQFGSLFRRPTVALIHFLLGGVG